jgi:hypothetical protein
MIQIGLGSGALVRLLLLCLLLLHLLFRRLLCLLLRVLFLPVQHLHLILDKGEGGHALGRVGTLLHCTALHCTALHCTALQYLCLNLGPVRILPLHLPVHVLLELLHVKQLERPVELQQPVRQLQDLIAHLEAKLLIKERREGGREEEKENENENENENEMEKEKEKRDGEEDD